MLYYTSKNNEGKVDATYSGRFAFICSLTQNDHKTITDLCKGNDMATLWSNQGGSDINKATRVLAHEYTHKKIYTLTGSGLILTGYRYWVRILFLLFKNYTCVKGYYRMRTVHLMETKPYHEDLAHQIDSELKSSQQSIEIIFEKSITGHYKQRIQNAEDRIIDTWKKMGLYIFKPWKILFGKLGLWFHENFAVRFTYWDSDKHFVHNVLADQGVSNDLENLRPEETTGNRIKKALMFNLILRPIYSRVNFQTRFEWYWIGQRTQFETLKELYGMDYSTFLNEIMHPSILFVMEWAGIPMHARSQLVEFAEDTLLMDRASFIRRWTPVLNQWNSDPHINLYLEFFHLHGN